MQDIKIEIMWQYQGSSISLQKQTFYHETNSMAANTHTAPELSSETHMWHALCLTSIVFLENSLSPCQADSACKTCSLCACQKPRASHSKTY